MSSEQPQQRHQSVPQPGGGPVETGHDDAPPTAAKHLKPSRSLPLEEAPTGYRNFKERQDAWTKVVLKPGMAAAA